MNLRLFLLVCAVTLFSCEKDDIEQPDIEYSSEISFKISDHLFSGKNIKQIEFVDNGFYYSIGNKIYLSDKSGSIINSFDAASDVLSMAYNQKDESLYFGTNSSGMGRAKGTATKYFTVENSDLPRNVVRQVECDGAGNVWFNTSAHMISGLVKYDGRGFVEYTPQNSDLPENLIHNFSIQNNTVYILSRGVETGKVGLKFRNNSWEKLFESGGCGPTDMDIDSDGNMYYIEDSREYCGGGLFPDNVVFSFQNSQKIILREYEDLVDSPYLLKTDKRDYVWVAKFASMQPKHISVFDGNKWHACPNQFPDDFINCIEVDEDNNIWLGTTNGIYVLNQ
ncbi:hypothetical protein N9164_15545 [Draconibacterium sp.]|nr:hypothetical protein [Draconibacterium sp.]